MFFGRHRPRLHPCYFQVELNAVLLQTRIRGDQGCRFIIRSVNEIVGFGPRSKMVHVLVPMRNLADVGVYFAGSDRG